MAQASRSCHLGRMAFDQTQTMFCNLAGYSIRKITRSSLDKYEIYHLEHVKINKLRARIRPALHTDEVDSSPIIYTGRT